MPQFTTILHSTDFSRPAEYAFELACTLARDHGGRLIVLHVAVPPVVGYGGAFTAPPEGDWQSLENQLRQIGASAVGIPIEHRLEEGDPASEILRVAQECKSDLIVMGTHGRTGISHLLMGSVAEKVVRKATCPVLVTKLPIYKSA